MYFIGISSNWEMQIFNLLESEDVLNSLKSINKLELIIKNLKKFTKYMV